MTTDELARELQHIDGVIALLDACRSGEDEEFEDRLWLQGRRRRLSALMAIRRAQKGKKVVSLAIWRDGGAAPRRAAAWRPELDAYQCGWA